MKEHVKHIQQLLVNPDPISDSESGSEALELGNKGTVFMQRSKAVE